MSDIRQFFDEHGYYHAKGVFDPASVATLEASFDGILSQLQRNGDKPDARWESAGTRLGAWNTQIWHTHQVQRFDATWLQACLHAPLLDVAEAILGPDIVLHHSKLFCKPAGTGAPFPIHQDWEYFPSRRDSMIAGIIHVSAASDEMGCLRVFPGSHRLGRIHGLSEGGHSAANEEILARHPIDDALVVEAEPGDVVFFHYFTLHGSLPNRSPRPRKTVLLQLHAGDDAPEDLNAHAYAGLALRGRNHAMSRHQAAQSH
jgi:ectoine hydroxylase-related dioxygenase (phytanoyl-CoA dioxygenase family)